MIAYLGDIKTRSELLDQKTSRAILQKILQSPILAIDTETSGLDCLKNEVILLAISDGEDTVVISKHSILLHMHQRVFDSKTLVAHNMKFDYNFLRTLFSMRNSTLYCTMVAEQKMMEGWEGSKFNLPATLERRGLPIPPEMDKSIREDFTKPFFTLQEKHVLYAGSDVKHLIELREKQINLLKKLGLHFHVMHHQMPLIKILATCEFDGIKIDVPKWLKRTKIYKRKTVLYEHALNILAKKVNPYFHMINVPAVNEVEKIKKRREKLQERIKLYNEKLENKNPETKAYKNMETMLEKCKTQLYDSLAVPLPVVDNLNWGSPGQVKAFFKTTFSGYILPTDNDGKISFSQGARDRWFTDYGEMYKNNSVVHSRIFYKLIVLFSKFVKANKQFNTFGEEWLTKYVDTKGMARTHYKQAMTATGRLASGDVKNHRFNSQQIPADNTLRSCFIPKYPNWKMVTCDLSGAELIIMCSHAQDHKLLELSRTEDLHSYMANKVWKEIYNLNNWEWDELDVISKTQNSHKRTIFKSMTFGTIYGMHTKKAAQTLGVNLKEAEVAIETIEKEIPETFTMVKSKIQEAWQNGYVIYNNRTKSRRWFKDAFSHKPLSKYEKSKVEGAARNCTIQGTQANMIIEAIVLIDRWLRRYKLTHKANFLLTVHDEVVYQYDPDFIPHFPQVVKEAMIRTANKYLENVEMDAEIKVGDSWLK